jgi:hypothetical protein
LISALVVLAVAALLAASGTLAVRRQISRQQPVAAARRFASELRLRRSEAIARARRQGLVFEEMAGEWLVSLHEDGDGDGLRADDRRRGRDPLREGPMVFERRYGALGPGFLPALEELSSPPPSSRPLGDLSDPVRFGRGDVVSFSPRGSATPGTLYLHDGDLRQLAVVVHGGSSRVRIWEWLSSEDRWVRR